MTASAPLELQSGTLIHLTRYNREGRDSSFLRHLFGFNPPFGERLWAATEEPLMVEPLRVVAVQGVRIAVEGPLLHDVRETWASELHQARYLEHVGFENLRIEFPLVPAARHHLETGYNGFYLTDLADSWLKNITIVNADSAILSDRVAFANLDAVRVEGRPGHYGIHLGDVHGVRVRDFAIEAESEHPVSFNTKCRYSVFTNGTLAEARFDQHGGLNHQYLFDRIRARVNPERPNVFEHGGAPYWGPTHAASNVFWNIELVVPTSAPSPLDIGGVDDAGTAVLVGVRANRPIELHYDGAQVVETVPPEAPSLYEWQVATRDRVAHRRRE